MNLYTLLEHGFPADRGETCFDVPGGRNRTWEELDHESAKIANWLVRLALPPGARVAAMIDKSPEGVFLYLATIRAGLVFVPLNSSYREQEIDYFLGNARPALVVCTERVADWLRPIAARHGVQHVMTLADDGTGSLLEAIAAQSTDFEAVDVDDQTIASILYTSGTTGKSKGAMLSHGNLGSNAAVLHDYWEWSNQDVLLHMLPIYHIHGLFVALHGALLAGAKMIWLPKFDPQLAIEHLPRSTMMMGVPTYYVRLLAESNFTAERCAKVRLFVCGSAPLLRETFESFRSRTGKTILERYGMSETGMLASNPCREKEGQRLGGTVGKPLPNVSLRIADDRGQICPPGEIGGIEVKGPGIFSGYWEMPERRAEDFTPDGYFRTGDLGQLGGVIDGIRIPDDYLAIVGRDKDLIISGGLNVYPKEIEGYIDQYPGVAECAVVGVPHPDFGEVGVAVVILRSGVELDGDAILAALKKRIAGFKVPKKVVFIDELPRNAMGKVQKNILRHRYRECFAGTSAGDTCDQR